jgi:TP901 family phage tail tape measure protein
MSMQGRAQISAQVNLASGTTDRLQSQLNALSKKLTLNINKVKIQNQQFNKSIQDGLKSAEKESIKQMKVVDDWQQQSAIKRWKLREKEEDNIRKLTSQQTKHIESQAKIRERVLNEEIKIRTKLIRLQESNNKPLDTGASTRFRIFDDLSRQQEQARLQQGIDNTRNRLSGEGIKRVLNPQEIAKINSQLDVMQQKISGVTNNKKLQQFNTEMGKIKHTLSQAGNEAKKTEYSLGTMLKNGIKGIFLWSIAATALYAPLRAFKQGLTTLKEIDTELVNIAKVTNMTKNEMRDLAREATQVGIALGRTTQEYLSAVTEFSRAGYGAEAKNLAEVALLLQNVGDISGDVATQMLLAVDASYKLGGSQEALMNVIDKINHVANNNATSVAKMAEGISVSASIMNQAGVSIDEFISLVGTATAVTQRSGSEIARGLRTSVLRLQAVTDADLDVTTESISKAEEVLNKYGIAVRTDLLELRAPFEIFRDISEKFRGELKNNEVAQAEIIQRVAGQRQANIVAAIVNNWGMVEKQMSEAMYSTGSAMKENERYMDSWQAKSKQLQTSMAQFWQTSINTDAVKRFIDGLRSIVEFMTKIGGLVPILSGLLAGILVSSLLTVDKALNKIVLKLTAINIKAAGLPILIGLIATGLTAWGMSAGATAQKQEQLIGTTARLISKDVDLIKQEKAHLDNVDKMIDRYEEITKKMDKYGDEVKLTEKESIDLETVTNRLKALFPQLTIDVKGTTSAYGEQIKQLRLLSQAERDHMMASAKTQKSIAEQQLKLATDKSKENLWKYESAGITQRRVLELSSRLDTDKGLQSAIANVEKAGEGIALKSAKEQNEFLKMQNDFISKYGNLFTGVGMNRSQITRSLSRGVDEFQKQLSTALEQANKNVNKYEPLVEAMKGHKDSLAESQAVINAILGLGEMPEAEVIIPTSINPDYESKFFSDNTGSLSSSSKSFREVQIDQFYKERQAVEDLNTELLKNQRLMSATDDDEVKLRLLAERIELLKQMRNPATSPLTLQANTMRSQIKKNLDQLRSQFGIQGNYDAATGLLKFENLERIYSFGDETRVVVDDIIKGTQDLEKEVKGLQSEWWSNNKDLINSMNEVESITKKIKDAHEELVKSINNAHKEQVSIVEKAELKIQEIIKKGLDMRKKAMNEELDAYKKLINDKISEKEREWEAEDLAKQKDKELANIQDLQKRINALSRDTSLSGVAQRKELEKQLADELEKIQEADIKRRRDLEKQAMQDSLKFKEESVADSIKELEKEWNNERITMEARDALFNKSFDRLRKEFPELFAELQVHTDDFFGVFDVYETKFGNNITSMRTSIKQLLIDVQNAANATRQLFQSQTMIAHGDTGSLSGNDLLIRQDKDRARIRDLQLEHNKLSELRNKGLPFDEKRLREIENEAKSIRSQNSWEFQDLRDYQTQFPTIHGYRSQGINAGAVTTTGAYMLHGSPSNPEWVLTNNQMLGMIKNLVKTPSTQLNGNGGTNLSIVVHGDADKGTVEKIKEAGKDLLAEFRNNFKKYSMG